MSTESDPDLRRPGESQGETRDILTSIPADGRLSDAEHGPVIAPETVAQIGAILRAAVRRRYDTAGGVQTVWVLESPTLSLALYQYHPNAPYTVAGDAEVHISSSWATGLSRPLAEFRGISHIDTDPDDPKSVHFVQEGEHHHALLVVNRDGHVFTSSNIFLTTRHPHPDTAR